MENSNGKAHSQAMVAYVNIKAVNNLTQSIQVNWV